MPHHDTSQASFMEYGVGVMYASPFKRYHICTKFGRHFQYFFTV